MGVIGIALNQPVFRPWHARWGATDEEILMELPGNSIVNGEVSQTTRGIAVHAAAAQIWPLLLQLGQGCGGMYSYDFLENLAGCDIHTLNVIDPALLNLQVGVPILMGPQEGQPVFSPRAGSKHSLLRTTGQNTCQKVFLRKPQCYRPADGGTYSFAPCSDPLQAEGTYPASFRSPYLHHPCRRPSHRCHI